MTNWKIYILVAVVVTAAGFGYVKSTHRNIPSDFRDAVADNKDFNTSIPVFEKDGGNIPAPKAVTVDEKASAITNSEVKAYTDTVIKADGYGSQFYHSKYPCSATVLSCISPSEAETTAKEKAREFAIWAVDLKCKQENGNLIDKPKVISLACKNMSSSSGGSYTCESKGEGTCRVLSGKENKARVETIKAGEVYILKSLKEYSIGEEKAMMVAVNNLENAGIQVLDYGVIEVFPRYKFKVKFSPNRDIRLFTITSQMFDLSQAAENAMKKNTIDLINDNKIVIAAEAIKVDLVDKYIYKVIFFEGT